LYMKVIGLFIACSLLFLESCAQSAKRTDLSKEENPAENGNSSRKKANSLYSEQESLKNGVIYNKGGKLKTASRLDFQWDNDGQLLVKDLNWDTEFKADL